MVLIALAWALVALPGLGSAGGTGLTQSEGHRVVPAIEMLQTGEWLVPHMFGQAYLRKPPGGIWAFAAVIRLTGDPVLGPRLVSAAAFLLLALSAWWFGRRWFGPTAGLAAGLATLLTPILWNPARSAELESLNNLFAALSAWTAFELVHRRACRPALATLALGGFVAAQMLVKGPAGVPAIGGMMLGSAWAARSARPLGCWRVWAGMGIGAAVFAGVALAIAARVRAAGADPVLQSPGAFLFEADRIKDFAEFLPLVFAGAVPMSLAGLFPWGPDARAEAESAGTTGRRRLDLARALTLGGACGALLLLVSGVSNPRYAQPVIATLGPLAGWGVAGVMEGMFGAKRRRIGRALTLGGPPVLACVLLAGSLVFAFVFQARKRATTGAPAGRDAARAVAPDLRRASEGGVPVVAADGVIEARPEILLAFRDEATRLGTPVVVRWIPQIAQIAQIDIPSDIDFVVVRDDGDGNETGPFGAWATVHRGTAHKYGFEWRVRPAPLD